MGLKPNLTTNIVQTSFVDNPFLSIDTAENVLSSTTSLFVDMTQSFYTASVHGIPVVHRSTTKHTSIAPLISREGGPIGELEIDDRGGVTNIIETFTLDQVAHVLMRSIFRLKEKWMAACDARNVNSSLRTIFLFVDGDSPVAKSETAKKRKSTNQRMKSIERECDKVMSMKRRKKEIMAIVSSKMEPVKHEVMEGGGLLIEGSLRRFLRRKENRSVILNHLVSVMTDSVHDCLRHLTIYLCLGHSDTQGTLDDQMIKLSGDYNHPMFTSMKKRGIPHLEADVMIPYMWSNIKEVEKMACVVSKDSDFLVTLLALADPNLHMMWTVEQGGKEKYIVYDNLVAIHAKPVDIPRNRLDLLLHLTMGGCDYVEGFPSCGKVAMLTGLKAIMERRDHVFFPNVSFAHSTDGKGILSFLIDEATDATSYTLKWAKALLASDKDLFCVRLEDTVYLLKVNHLYNDTPLQWYTNRCSTPSKAVREGMRTEFASAMKRRMYFLSNVTETRVGLERDIVNSCDLAMKCGYISNAGYSYENKMLKK